MKIHLSEAATVFVEIHHDRATHVRENLPGVFGTEQINRGTKVILTPSWTPISAIGKSVCAVGDTFSKRKGGTLAMRRALAQTNLTKQERRKIYFAIWPWVSRSQ